MSRRLANRVATVVAWTVVGACDPDVVVGLESDAGPLESDGGSLGSSDGSRDPDAGQSEGDGDPPLPWSAYHETGDLSEWTGDGFGWRYVTTGGTLVASTEAAHDGSHALASTIAASGAQEQAVVGRHARLLEGYYTAWFLVPSAAEFTGRVLYKLSSSAPYADRFDLILTQDLEGTPRVRLFEHAVESFVSEPEAAPPFPLDSWVELETFYRSAPGSDGRLAAWQNGALIVDTGPRGTAPDDQVAFVVGSVTEVTEAQSVATYVDDVSIRAGQYLSAP